jgi:hypothetical protein
VEKPALRSEQHGPLPIDHPRVEMGHGHWRRANSGLPVDFRMVSINQLRLVQNAAIARLQESRRSPWLQECPTSAKVAARHPPRREDEFRIDRPLRSVPEDSRNTAWHTEIR